MPLPDLIPLAAVSAVTLAASATDLWKFKVYNILTFPALLLGLAASAGLGGWSGLSSSLLGAGLGLALLFVFFAMGGVGAGDVKLLMAVGAWLGPRLTWQVFVASALAAGLYAAALVVARGGMLALSAEALHLGSARPRASIGDEVARPDRRRRLVPFAAMTCVGYFATIACWWSDLRDVWPPYKVAAPKIAATSTLGPGGGR